MYDFASWLSQFCAEHPSSREAFDTSSLISDAFLADFDDADALEASGVILKTKMISILLGIILRLDMIIVLMRMNLLILSASFVWMVSSSLRLRIVGVMTLVIIK